MPTTPLPVISEVIEQATRLANLYSLGVVLAVIITVSFVSLMAFVLWVGTQREQKLTDLINTTVAQQTSALMSHETRMFEGMKTLMQANEYQRQEHRELVTLIRDARRL